MRGDKRNERSRSTATQHRPGNERCRQEGNFGERKSEKDGRGRQTLNGYIN
jgi:hypothetical protein